MARAAANDSQNAHSLCPRSANYSKDEVLATAVNVVNTECLTLPNITAIALSPTKRLTKRLTKR
eukprot:4225853-Pyramimonas_sp.AAC.1